MQKQIIYAPGYTKLLSKSSRSSWTPKDDYTFVSILAQYTVCNAENGLVLDHKYVDSTIISHAQAVLTQNVNLDIVEVDLAKRFPNKREEHRSKDCLSLLLELKSNLPEFTFHQLNHKHINMWTRSIVPFRLLYDSGILFKGKSIFHKDCKRFVKCIFTFLNYTRTRGLMEPLTKVFARLPGQGNKLLEQWLCVMFEIHNMNFAWFLYECACKMAQSFINSKLPQFITEREIELLNDKKPKLELLCPVINDYLMQINEFEGCAAGTISKKELVGALNHKPAADPNNVFFGVAESPSVNYSDLADIMPAILPAHKTLTVKHASEINSMTSPSKMRASPEISNTTCASRESGLLAEPELEQQKRNPQQGLKYMTNDELRQIQEQFIEQKKRREQQYAREQADLKQSQYAREQEAMREQLKLSSPALKFNNKVSGNISSAHDQLDLLSTELRQQVGAHPYARQPRSFSSPTTATSNTNLPFKLADLKDLEQSKLKEDSGYKYNAPRSMRNSKSSTGYNMLQPPLNLQFPMPEPEKSSNYTAFTNVSCSLQNNQGMVYTDATGYASPERISEPLVSEYNAYSMFESNKSVENNAASAAPYIAPMYSATDIRSLLVSSNDTDNGSSKNITIQPDVFNKLVDEIMNTDKTNEDVTQQSFNNKHSGGDGVYYKSGIDALLAATRTL